MLKESNISDSKTNLKIAWVIFTIIATVIGFKLKNMELTIVLLVGIPTMLFLIKKPKRLIYTQIIYIFIIKTFGFPNSTIYVYHKCSSLYISNREKTKRKTNSRNKNATKDSYNIICS